MLYKLISTISYVQETVMRKSTRFDMAASEGGRCKLPTVDVGKITSESLAEILKVSSVVGRALSGTH